MRKALLLLFAELLITTICISQTTRPNNSIHCIIKGNVIDRPNSSKIILVKQGDDIRTSGITIPIIDGKFEYKFNCKYIELYTLLFYEEQRRGRPCNFFSEPGVINVKLYPMERYYQNTVTGGDINRAYTGYNREADSLFKDKEIDREKVRLKNEDRIFTEEAKQLMKKIKETDNAHISDSLNNLAIKLDETGKALTPEAKALQDREIKLGEDCQKWQLNYIRDHKSLVGYSLLIDAMERKYEVPECMNIFHAKFENRFPLHPYTWQMKSMIQSFLAIKTGNPFIDFTAPDTEGKLVSLSSQIKGKVALIDLWASWCFPCRKKAISMIAVYEAYKDKGFTIVGVARESKISDGINAIKKDKYPWLNLIELNDAGKIWERYDARNSGGKTILVDKNGIILAIDPTEEKVKTILSELLK